MQWMPRDEDPEDWCSYGNMRELRVLSFAGLQERVRLVEVKLSRLSRHLDRVLAHEKRCRMHGVDGFWAYDESWSFFMKTEDTDEERVWTLRFLRRWSRARARAAA